jgi:hypothetical protein
MSGGKKQYMFAECLTLGKGLCNVDVSVVRYYT